MTPERMRIVIGQACGWTRIRNVDPESVAGMVGISPDSYGTYIVPNYPADLNACYEIEENLKEVEYKAYVSHLDHIVYHGLDVVTQIPNGPFYFRFMRRHTKAIFRCEAFLKAKGLWEEEG